MGLSASKQSVPISLPKEIVQRIDQMAAAKYKTRAGLISDVVIEYVLSQPEAAGSKQGDGQE